jgi:hypothetical protein
VYLLVPHEVSGSTATLWMAAADENVPIEKLQLIPQLPGQQLLPAGEWPSDGAIPRLRYRKARITGLVPRQTYKFALSVEGQQVAHATVTTLPRQMPMLGDKPFTILLGSCFAHREDEEGKLGTTVSRMPHQARPDLKFLAGDQVYLDDPWHRFARRTHSVAELRRIFFENYIRTWGQTDGFARLLQHGANYFCSDDHEFWNNAPNSATFILDTWPIIGRRAKWWRDARHLYEAFQTSKAVQEVRVPPVSFLIADTRMNRSDVRDNFMEPSDLQHVRNWVEALDGPGVLLIGQPLLQTSTGFLKGHFMDWNLPDYRQYHEFAGIVGASEHSLVILSGDVHYGRIARSTLASGAELIEIISSPMSLVNPAVKGKWERAPDVFPAVRPDSAAAHASLARSGVVSEPDFHPVDSHFLTLEFTKRGAGAQLGLRYWPISAGGMTPPEFGKLFWERTLT